MSVRIGFSGNVVGSYLTSGSKKVSNGIDSHGDREAPAATGLSLLVVNRVGVAAAGRQVACKPHER